MFPLAKPIMMDVAVIRLKLVFFLFALWLILPFSVWGADIAVSVDRNSIGADESFQIIFSASQAPDGAPDFSPLDKDFTRLGTSQEQAINWVNGSSSQVSKWIVTAMAKRSGSLSIPAIAFGKDASRPLPIEVKSAAAQDKPANGNPELFLEVSAAPENPYLQSQVIYTLKLYTRVDIAQARLSEPELADAVIEKLGDDSNYNSRINGVDYSVTERSYAIFPQKSGTMTVKPLQLTAEIVDGNNRSFGGFFSSPFTRNKRVESKAVTLQVRPLPAGFTGAHWLPAEQLELSQQWSGDVGQMKVGEPLTRTLTLTARGAGVGQLPELNTGINDPALRIYPDQPVLQEQKAAGGVIAQRQEKLAVMPNKPGNYTLPEITVPWFNTVTEKMELATLPAMTVTVQGQAAEPSPAKPATAISPQAENKAARPASQPEQASPSTFWQWLSVFLGSAWLLTLGYFLSRPKPKLPVAGDLEAAKAMSQEKVVAQLRQACEANDAIAAKNALLAWGQQQFDAVNLGAVARHCEARLRDEILVLNQILYGKNAGEWQGKKLFQAFSENKARKKIAGKGHDGLKPLYPL